jgi:hypothetical protein
MAGYLGWACAEAPPDPRAPSTVAMAERLQQMATEVEPWSHPYAGSARLDSMLEMEPPRDLARKVTFEARIAREAIHAGRTEEGIERFKELVAQFPALEGRIEPALMFAIIESLGLAHLRLWERDNCERTPEIGPCLFPVDPGPGASSTPARAAAEVYGSLLQVNPDDLSARWLLNLAHMMIGDYPGGVPASFVIPPDALRSEHDPGRFQDIAPALGLDVLGHAGGGIMDDFDGDGDLDIVASSWHLRDQLRFFRNEGNGTFRDATIQAGLRGIVGGLNLAQADYDNDGALDILVLRGAWTTYGEPNSLLRNTGDGTFEDVTEAAGLLAEYPTQTASWGDYDNDGWLDLFVGNESTDQRTIPSQLFRNNRDGTFTDVGAESGVAVTGFVKAVAWGDIDNDGWLDLYVSRLWEPNLLLRNDGPGTDGPSFSDVTATAGVAEPIASFPIWFWDYDNDGWLDIFVSGYRGTPGDLVGEYLGLPHEGEFPRLYRNDRGGTFTDVTREARLERVLLTMGSNYGDLDNDGYLDFYAGTGEANMQTIVPNRMFRNAGGVFFQDVTTSGGFGHLGKGHGVAYGDVDHDGDQDIYVTMGGAYEADVARNLLFENHGKGRHWITLSLEGVRANRAAIGARVKVMARTEDGALELHRVVSSGSSFGANSLDLEVGLGQATRVDVIEIVWPGSGVTERFTDVEIDRAYRVREGDGSLTPRHLEPFRLSSASDRR